MQTFDREPLNFDSLFELSVDWRPTYPYADGTNGAHAQAHCYSTTRAPAWPDRVLMTKAANTLVQAGHFKYEMVGGDAAMGDHKPVLLSFELPALPT